MNEDTTMNNPTTRRNLLIAASLGGAAATAGIGARAEEHASLGLDEKRQFHTEFLVHAFDTLGSDRALSREGMMRTAERLHGAQILDQHDYETLHGLVSHLFDDNDLDTLRSNVERIVADAASLLGEAAESIAAVMQSSVDLAREMLGNLDHAVVRNAIAHDIEGALYGAAAGYTLRANFSWPVAD